MDPLRRSSVKIGTIQRRLAWPLLRRSARAAYIIIYVILSARAGPRMDSMGTRAAGAAGWILWGQGLPGPRHQPLFQFEKALTPIANGHTAMNAPDPIRTRKLSMARPGQYWGGGPPGKPFGCRWLFALLQTFHGDLFQF